MKKRILFIIMALLAIVLVVAACGGGEEEPTPTPSQTQTNTDTNQGQTHEHEWALQGTTATCTQAGKDTYKCTVCEATEERDAAALTHDMQFVETIKATCQEGGYDAYACSREGCDETERRHETDPSFAPDAHVYVDEGVPATCIAGGYSDQVCSLCGTYSGNRVNIPAKGHTYEREGYDGVTGAVQTAPTCEANGQIVYTCTEEGCIGNATADGAAVKVETYEDMVAAGASYANDYKALGHNYTAAEDGSNVQENVAPTCTTAGYVIYACQNGCGTTSTVTDGYEALTHTYERNPDKSTWTYAVEIEPTCINVGTEWVVCTDCEHNTKDDAVANPLKYSRDIAATGAHVYDKNATVTAPTCTLGGYTTYFCSADAACVASEQRDQTPANGHTWGLKESDLQDGKPFCKTDGNWNYICSVCQKEEYNVNDDEPIANALHTGYTPGDFTGGKAPTCITRGSYYCSGCKTVFNAYADDTLANATGAHTYNTKGQTTASTCSTYGYTTYHCDNDANCVETERRDYTPFAAHSYSDPSEDGTIVCFACSSQYRDVTTEIETKDDKLCTCGNKGTEACTCSLKVEFIATKVPDADPFAITAGAAFEKSNFNFEKYNAGPALLILNGEESTVYTVTVYDAENNAITTYDIIVDGNDVGDANVVTGAQGVVAYINLAEVAPSIAKVVITATTDATVRMYYAI